MGKKKILADILDNLKIFNFTSKFNKSNLLVSNYHRLYSSDTLRTEFNDGVYEYTDKIFKHHLKNIIKNYDVISERDLLDISIDGRIPKRCAVITFDDGYIDNYTLAFPILKSLKLPAFFFIPTDAIENRVLGWWDIISYLIKKSKKKDLVVGEKKIPLENEKQKKYAVAYFIDKMKTTPYEKNKNLLETLSYTCGVDIPSTEKQSRQLMTWEQLNEVTEHNITVGSHTHTHRVLSTLNEREQFYELKKSKEILEQRLKRTINSMSYPVGGYLHFSDRTKELAEEAGYKLCFSYETGYNRKKLDAYDIKRIGLSNTNSIMKGQLCMPSLFC